MTRHRLTEATASKFARIALGHVGREYPNAVKLILRGDADLKPPRMLYPIFHGSLDWHSCVHGYWLLATVLRLCPGIPEATAIRQQFEHAFTADKVAGERAMLAQPGNRGFERPYGWAWLLMLQAELLHHVDDAGRRHAAILQPLADDFVARFRSHLPLATYPVRVGTHFNTAFALRLAADYADAVGDTAFMALLKDCAWRWHAQDRDAQAWEPSGDDFLSSTLIEAEALRRLLPSSDFARWFDAFLPRLAAREPASLFMPAEVSDPSDGKIAHLDGLNLSRAWCWRSLAASLPVTDARRAVLLESAERHLDASLAAVAGDYMGEHWLATFALLALLAAE